MIVALRKPKTTVFAKFFAFGSKHHGIDSSFCLGPSKNTGIYELQDVVSTSGKRKNTAFYDVFLLLGHRKKRPFWA